MSLKTEEGRTMKSALDVTQGGEVSGFRKKLLLKGEIQRKSRLPKYNGALGMTMVKDRPLSCRTPCSSE